MKPEEELKRLQETVIKCKKCPRLVSYLNKANGTQPSVAPLDGIGWVLFQV